MVIALFAGDARAQAGVTAAGLLSIQPVDDWYGGPPYLDEGIGGRTFGATGGIDVALSDGLVVIGEVSTTLADEQAQVGRLVDTRRDRFGSGHSDTRLSDTLFSGLIGVAPWQRRVWLVGGVSLLHTMITEDGEKLAELDFDGEGEHRRLAFTGGVDVRVPLSPRASLTVSGRYSLIDRAELARDLGAGPHIIRIAGGVRIRLR